MPKAITVYCIPEYEPPVTFRQAKNFSWKFQRETDYDRIVFQINEPIDRRINIGPDDNVISLDAPAYPNSDRNSAGRAKKTERGHSQKRVHYSG